MTSELNALTKFVAQTAKNIEGIKKKKLGQCWENWRSSRDTKPLQVGFTVLLGLGCGGRAVAAEHPEEGNGMLLPAG